MGYVNHTVTGGWGSTRTASVPSGTVDGDVMLAFTSNNNTSTEPLTAPSGWTLLDEQNSTNVEMECWYRVASSEPASYVWTWSGNHNHNVVIATYRDVGAPNWWETNAASAVTIITTTDVEALAADAILVCAAMHPNGGTWTETGGLMTARNTSGRLAVWDQVLAASGPTGTRTLDTNTPTNANMASAAVVMEAAAPAPSGGASGWGIILG